MRTEADVFADLSRLCQAPGYVHALAYLCFRDTIIAFEDEMHVDDVLPMLSPDKLSRTEISTLLGLLVQGDQICSLPSAEATQHYIDETERLLRELHETFLPEMRTALEDKMRSADPHFNPLQRGSVLREAIFYAGESAYNFQYRELAVRKYANDDAWLRANRGFSIVEARDVILALTRIQSERIPAVRGRMLTQQPDQWTFLPAYIFTPSDIVAAAAVPAATVNAVLDAFTLATGERNGQFQALSDFNKVHATPILKLNGHHLLLQSYTLLEALYDSPFYWMIADHAYADTAMRNRGAFTESFCRERLAGVLGRSNVHANVRLSASKGKTIGEIDVLAIFGDRAIIVQAKAKRLTLAARKGNDGQLRDDFKKSVKDAYDQAVTCAQQLTHQDVAVVDADGRTLPVPQIQEIYLLCIVADHYPALNFQASQFLPSQREASLNPPLVLDVFGLDAITEMLSSPLRLLSYLHRRANYTGRLSASHELIMLSYHLKYNLWVEGDTKLILNDDLSAELDVAMMVRREGIQGQRTPDGPFTRLANTAVGRLISEIEDAAHASMIALGMVALALSEAAAMSLSEGIEDITRRAREDSQIHDITIPIDAIQTGITVHANEALIQYAAADLHLHCEGRKYMHKAASWFGVCLRPSDGRLRFGFKLEYGWRFDQQLEDRTRDIPPTSNP